MKVVVAVAFGYIGYLHAFQEMLLIPFHVPKIHCMLKIFY